MGTHEPEPHKLYAIRHDCGNGIYKCVMKEKWGPKFDPGQSEPNENTCGDVLENYLGVANMALRFPQVVKPLGEPWRSYRSRSGSAASWRTWK